MDFEEALKIAQELGYAEHDPTADVEGIDACRKICILASLAFGKHVYPDNVHTEGITNVTLEDVEYMDSFDAKIKLIGCARREEGNEISIGVFPAVIKDESQLAGVNDVFNAILVRGDATGDVVFYGKGAGKLPTASADNVEVTKAVIKALFGNVEYLSSKKQPENELAFITGVMSEKDTLNACEKVSDGAKILGRIRVLDY